MASRRESESLTQSADLFSLVESNGCVVDSCHTRSSGRGGGSEDPWSDDDPDSEEDDEFQKTKLMHDKKRRQAEKVTHDVIISEPPTTTCYFLSSVTPTACLSRMAWVYCCAWFSCLRRRGCAHRPFVVSYLL